MTTPGGEYEHIERARKEEEVSKPEEIVLPEAIPNTSFKEWKPVPVKWAIEGLVPLGDLTIIGAREGAYKTYATMGMMFSGTNRPYLGEFYSRGVKWLYIDAENKVDRIHRRTFEMGYEQDDEERMYHMYISQKKMSEQLADAIIKRCRKLGCKGVVLDHYSAFLQGSENEQEPVQLFFDQIKKLEDAGLTIILLMHLRKGSSMDARFHNERDPQADDLRGHGVPKGAAASILMHKPIHGGFEVFQRKMRDAASVESFTVNVTGTPAPKDGIGSISLHYAGKREEGMFGKEEIACKAIVQLLENDGMFRQDIIESVKESHGVGERNIKDALKKMYEEGVLNRTVEPDSSHWYYLAKNGDKQTEMITEDNRENGSDATLQRVEEAFDIKS